MATKIKVCLASKPWVIDLEPVDLSSDRWGECDLEEREIRVSPQTVAKGNFREILIHEILHAEFPKASEKIVTRAAREINQALIRCGEKPKVCRKKRPSKKS